MFGRSSNYPIIPFLFFDICVYLRHLRKTTQSTDDADTRRWKTGHGCSGHAIPNAILMLELSKRSLIGKFLLRCEEEISQERYPPKKRCLVAQQGFLQVTIWTEITQRIMFQCGIATKHPVDSLSIALLHLRRFEAIAGYPDLAIYRMYGKTRERSPRWHVFPNGGGNTYFSNGGIGCDVPRT